MLANRQKLRMQICCNGLPKSLDGLLHNLTPKMVGAMKIYATLVEALRKKERYIET
jgi:hypothetical protein